MPKRWTLKSPSGETWEGDEPWLLVSRATRQPDGRAAKARPDNSFQEVRRFRTERAGMKEHND